MVFLRKHNYPSSELELPQTLHSDRHKLEEVDVPIVTVSASYRGDIAKQFGEIASSLDEAIFSRAHFSMALAVYKAALLQDKSAWLVDPLNYVSKEDWTKIAFVERVAKLAARFKVLKSIKDRLSTLIRGNLPISKAIRAPLLYVTGRTTKPVISLHYEAGNILAESGKKVLQVVTDPYVHKSYLESASRQNIFFAVFDEGTKNEFVSKANNPVGERIFVTGPPVDPDIIALRKNKSFKNFSKKPLRLAITTSGLGTNKSEIYTILNSLFPRLAELKVELLLYASTHIDFKQMFTDLAHKHSIQLGGVDSKANVRLLYERSLVKANSLLVEHAFSWADGFVTKPSGDMAYDAVAAGCFLLTLAPWGAWEEKIYEIFKNKQIAKEAQVEDFPSQINYLRESGWFKKALDNAQKLDPLFLNGAKKIVDLHKTLSYNG